MTGKKGRSGRRRAPRFTAGAPSLEQFTKLLQDLDAIKDNHPELYQKVYELLGWLLLPGRLVWRVTDNKDWYRLLMMHDAFDNKGKSGRMTRRLNT